MLIDEHGLVLEPTGPGFLGDVLEDAFAQLSGIRRSIETGRFALENDTLNGTGHGAFLAL
jgi:hypothetical protein